MKDVNEKTYIPCVRCGVCCSSGVCSNGVEDDRGLCDYLILSKNNASCKLLLENKINPKDIGIGVGCILRQIPFVFQYYEDQMRKKLLNMKSG